MKFGIITFHDANNYGAVLQAYALRKKINQYYYCSIINYYNKYFHRNEKIHGIKSAFTKLLYRNQIKNKNMKFDKFRKEYLKISTEIIKDEDIFYLNDKYDCFITGSDQVWNLNCSGNNDVYFLNFVKEKWKKNSFSASFGTQNPELDKKHLNYINEFSHISVREKSGYEYLRKNNIVCKKTTDPVFLLDKEEWESLTESSNEKYILIYEVVNGTNMIKFAKELSKKTGYEIKIITSSNKPIWGVKCLRNIGPIEWLKLMRNAQYVITNSFHGLAFSLIFNKQFFIEPLSNSESNNRMLEILEEFNLKTRLIKDTNIEDLGTISYKKVNEIIETNKKTAFEYINSIFRSVMDNEKQIKKNYEIIQ